MDGVNETFSLVVWVIISAVVTLAILFYVIRGAILSALREDRRRTAAASEDARL